MFKNKTILITGAADGIGKAAVIKFLEQKANVVGLDSDKKKIRMMEKKTMGKNLMFIHGDVSVPEDRSLFVDKALEKFKRIDVLINNAGIEYYKPIQEATKKDWDYVHGVNLEAPYFLSQLVIKYFIKNKIKGVIVNVSSLNAVIGNPFLSAYAASKGGVVAMSRSMAVELGEYGIRVNSICPGSILTNMVRRGIKSGCERSIKELGRDYPLKRVGEPDEVADLILFLASDNSSFITGANIIIDGGYSVK